MLFSSLAGVTVTDKQDPSFVTDISHLHVYFTHHGYHALGMYLKALHNLVEESPDKSLDPYQRAYKAWYAKSFFTIWKQNVAEWSQFISWQMYLKDICCSCDGLILYFSSSSSKETLPIGPDFVFLPWVRCKWTNEQVFAYILVSCCASRKTTLDASTLAYGMEKHNVRSDLSLSEDVTAYGVCPHKRKNCSQANGSAKLERVRKPFQNQRPVIQLSGRVQWLMNRIFAKLCRAVQITALQKGRAGSFLFFFVLMILKIEHRMGTLGDQDCSTRGWKCWGGYRGGIGWRHAWSSHVWGWRRGSSKKIVNTLLYLPIRVRIGNSYMGRFISEQPRPCSSTEGNRKTNIMAMKRQSRFTGDAFGVSSDIRLFNKTPCGLYLCWGDEDRRHNYSPYSEHRRVCNWWSSLYIIQYCTSQILLPWTLFYQVFPKCVALG